MTPGWEQEVVLGGSGAGRGARAADSRWDQGQPRGAGDGDRGALCLGEVLVLGTLEVGRCEGNEPMGTFL